MVVVVVVVVVVGEIATKPHQSIKNRKVDSFGLAVFLWADFFSSWNDPGIPFAGRELA